MKSLAQLLAVLLAFSCFSIRAQASGPLTTLYKFSLTSGTNYTNSDGAFPYCSLTLGSDGNFYGVTYRGGSGGCGTMFRLTPTGTFTHLTDFGNDGQFPSGDLLAFGTGHFLGTTGSGGNNGGGTTFEAYQDGTINTLYSFGSPNLQNTDGYDPTSGLILGEYGTTFYGGSSVSYGTVFQTGGNSLITLHSFTGYPNDGAYPRGVTLGNDGNLYGVTASGGVYYDPYGGFGTVYKITPQGVLTILHSFTPTTGSPGTNADGVGPAVPMMLGSDGNFYGVAGGGGTYGYGTIFKITPDGTLTTLHSFNKHDGAVPESPLLLATDGNFYGMTVGGGKWGYGTIYRLTSAGVFTSLYSFHFSDGAGPAYNHLTQGPDGRFYGTTSSGGYGNPSVTNGSGTLFSFLPVYMSTLSPTSVDAAGPAFTLMVNGNGFLDTSVVTWNGSSLRTTYVSPSLIKAAVPASLIASPGKATIAVSTSSLPASNTKTLPIPVTSIGLVSASLTRNSSTGALTATITLQNTGYLTANNASITKATLGTAFTTSILPAPLGNLAAGASVNTALSFPGSAGTPGQVVALKVSGTFTGGKFAGLLKVSLP